MTFKRLKQPVMRAAVFAALALGGSALAGSATAAGDVTPAKTAAAPPASVARGSVQAMNHVRDGWIHDLYLSDHEQYVRHHQRLGS